ncbi:MAG: PQQ-dependent sugar dehydrogenase [Bacteroidota bacterium]|nr:PQQ-dependent sugar dehydrogenase [Bacteroidota bacterium]MDP4215116.1 PQQ-dependent sugar dehydrogenase [Bacteroidota bacterium]MDP4245155.1 PQQ-dependent sugar dehydrogenase [Bacteroidota bacterium]MDP4254429.1 PQQ-dependent sugar dehydrogenase [Bacteroidota bacterium]MDP4259458.1 PQQ-dependent sugar dehydrogenase [Bacteroidota bacterium]
MKHAIIVGIISLLSLPSIFSGCKKNSSPSPSNAMPDLQLVADGLVSPVAMAEAPDSSHRLFIVDETGKIWIIGADGKKAANPFIDLSSKMVTLSPNYDERGLLGLAFHPQFKTNHKFYLFYTAPPRPGTPVPGAPGALWNNTTTISEFTVSAADSNIADMGSERVLIRSDHPYLNHNGGTLAFGPDGFLYISIGDGGNKDDVGNGHVNDWYAVNQGGNGQDIYMNLMGNILRIDVNGSPYHVPADNPFVGTTAKPEIWAYGFRNPYRFSFDMGGSHQLLVGDEGQSLYEEVDDVTRGGNYGWNVKEGTHCFDTDSDLLVRASCPNTDSAGKPLIDPVIEMVNTANPKGGGLGIAVIGGMVYRGSALPALVGKYLFGMLSTSGKADGQLYSSTPETSGMWPFEPLALKSFTPNLGTYLKSIGQDRHGEIYVLTSDQLGPQGTTGKVYKLVAAP